MVSNTKQQLNKQVAAMGEIVYAAFQTHFKCVYSKEIAANGLDADEAAAKHWNDNPGAKTLWEGLVHGLVVNLSEAQRQGLVPKLQVEAPPALVGLGGAPLGPRPETLPAALASRVAAKMGGTGATGQDTPPGLAVGRCTGDDC